MHWGERGQLSRESWECETKCRKHHSGAREWKKIPKRQENAGQCVASKGSWQGRACAGGCTQGSIGCLLNGCEPKFFYCTWRRCTTGEGDWWEGGRRRGTYSTSEFGSVDTCLWELAPQLHVCMLFPSWGPTMSYQEPCKKWMSFKTISDIALSFVQFFWERKIIAKILSWILIKSYWGEI